MRSIKAVLLFAAMIVGCLGTVGCHYDRDTAGHSTAEDNALPGSVAATKAGTGDAKVGSGAGQVGTDAQPHEKPGPHTGISAK